MPIYEYRCRNGHSFEVFQAMTEDPVAACEVCGEPVERVFHPVAVHFKGSGFYTTDYAKGGARKAATDGGSSSDGAGDGEGKAKEKAGSGEGSGSGSSGSDDKQKAGAAD